MSTIPNERRRLRACLLCGLVKTQPQFAKDGCQNCSNLLQRINGDRMPSADQYTSASYAGLAAIMNPQKSWVAKWQRNDKFVTGMYALRVMGRLSADLQDQMMDEGIKYRPRDGSVQD